MLPNHRQLAVGIVSLALLLTPVAAGAVEAPTTERAAKMLGSTVKLLPANIPDGYLDSDNSTDPSEVSEEQEAALASPESNNAYLAVVDLSSPLAVAGLSWESADEAPETVLYRLQEGDAWGSWHEIRTEASLGGTDPILLPNVTAAEVLVPQTEAEGIALNVIDPDDYPELDADFQGVDPSNGEAASFDRSDWLNEDAIETNSAEALSPSGVVIHDVQGSSDYQLEQVPALLRAIHLYQSDVLGWQDIGYHFIVDKFGNMWEGLAGSYEAPVAGGFSPNNGNQALDIAVLADFAQAEPSEAEMKGLAEVTAGAFESAGADVEGTLTVTNDGDATSFTAIAGHRDISDTLSPGDQLYSRLGDLKTAVVELLDGDAQNSASETEEPLAAQAPSVRATPSAGKWGAPVKIGHGWSGKIIFPGDWNRNGHPDIMRIDDQGDLYYYAGTGNQRFSAPVKAGYGWGGMTWIQGGIDWTGNGNNDIIARHTSGDLYLYRGNGKGGFAGSQKIGRGWSGLSNLTVATTSAGTSIYGVTAAGVLLRYPANGKGGFGNVVTYGAGWNSMNHLVGVGNWNDDGYQDFLARKTNGDLLLYPGRANGGIGAGIKIGHGWGGMKWIGASNQRANAQPLWAIDASGNLLSYSFNGKGVGTVVAPAPKLPAKVTYKNGVYTFNMVHSAQQTNYWCGPASVFMVLERLGYVKSTKGAWLSQKALAGNAYLQTDRYGKTSWARNNLSTGVAAWTGNKVKYTRQAAPSAAAFRTRVSDSVTKTGRPIILDAQEYYGGSHYNNHPVYSEFSHLMPVQSYNPSTDVMTVLDPASHYYPNSSKVFSHKVGAFASYLRAFGIYY